MTSSNSGTGPVSYAKRVQNYSKLGVSDAYFSGQHYSRLGRYLNSPYESFGTHWAQPDIDDTFPFVTIHDFRKSGSNNHRPTYYTKPEELLKSLCAPGGPITDTLHTQQVVGDLQTQESHIQRSKGGRIVFIRGFPSARWLNHLGFALHLDPEFLYRHLQVPREDLPESLRSERGYITPFPRSQDLLQLRVCTTGAWRTAKAGTTLTALRRACQDQMLDHIENFARMQKNPVGGSIVRKFMLHSLDMFSIEQQITIEVVHDTEPWTIAVWADSGSTLSHCNTGPWLSSFEWTKSTRLFPCFQHRAHMALSSGTKPATGIVNAEHQLSQSISHLHLECGRRLKVEVAAQDAFYALTEIFEFSAASIDQFLEVCEHTVRDERIRANATELVERLMLKKQLDDYRNYLKDTFHVVQNRGGTRWPRAEDAQCREWAVEVAQDLELRYLHLLARCERLQEECGSSITLLTNRQAQDQTDRAIEQTEQLNKLSVLAYFYIPMTFAASFFGMNFKELGTSSNLSIYLYFVVAVPMLIGSILAWFLKAGSIWAKLRGWYKQRSARKR